MASDSSRWSSEDERQLAPVQGLPGWVRVVSLGICLLVGLGSLALWFSPATSDHRTLFAGPEIRPVAVAGDGYVGSSACQTCHRHESETWHDSFHRTMTQIASPTSVVGDFSGAELQHAGAQYRLGRDQENCWVEFDAPQSVAGEPFSKLRRNVVLCTGSHHMQVYWLSTGRGRELAVLPFAWLIAEKRWIPREACFLQLPAESDAYEPGRWNRSCIGCHTTHGNRNLQDDAPPQSTVSEFGIACEACHGPGELHVQHHSQANKSQAADPITHPLRLPHERASEVCGQCHMAWHTEVAQSGLTYRPGDDLRSLRATTKKPSQFWPDGMVRVVGREFNGLIESACFQHGELSCFSCHQMHQSEDDMRPRADWADDQLKPDMRGNEACLACHDDYRALDKLESHTHHSSSSDGSRCYNCHMPNTTYGLLKATRSHRISSPSAAETVASGRPNACNLCHLDKPLTWTAENLAAWYGQASTKLPVEWSETAVSVRLALAGDAGQRALIAWHMSWAPAREASGEQWLPPYLAILLADDYPAVRFIAHRSLAQIEGYGDLGYSRDMPEVELQSLPGEITSRWSRNPSLLDKPMLLISPTGALDGERITEILKQRDHTVISLDE
ncbi:MAG: multiheme c-type cytochrome [Planctomycetota bacterium]|nr:multiheme c-type cytochrome [Planctomycetota bacterium]